MNPAVRLGRELGQLAACLSMSDFTRYLVNVATHTPEVARRRSLVPADRAMTDEVCVTLHGRRIVVPLKIVQELLHAHHRTPTFGAVREMYAGNIYLRAFKPDLRADTVLDLGSNRGLFLLLANKVLDARLSIGVEPQSFYESAFWAIVEANGIDPKHFDRISKFVASTAGPAAVTVPQIMQNHGLASIAFMKCDIEGGEFDVFCNRNEFLRRVDNIAMELHPDKGEVGHLVSVLTGFGFIVRVTDQFGGDIPHAMGHYLYASRVGALTGSP